MVLKFVVLYKHWTPSIHPPPLLPALTPLHPLLELLLISNCYICDLGFYKILTYLLPYIYLTYNILIISLLLLDILCSKYTSFILNIKSRR